MSWRDPVRLSRFVVFVEYDDHVEVQHTLRGTVARTTKDEHAALQRYWGFAERAPELAVWVERGVLVVPFEDVARGRDVRADTEQGLAAAYHRWYWAHEVETEREYRWLGHVVVKMPSDLFFYQEVLSGKERPRILELGHGRGGGVWFFASMARLLGGGVVVSVDDDPTAEAVDVSGWAEVQARLVVGDAADHGVVERVAQLEAEFDLVVADLGGPVHRNLDALARWIPLVARDGTFVLEDVWGGGPEEEVEVVRRVDEVLLDRPELGLDPRASRHPLLKGLALRRADSR